MQLNSYRMTRFGDRIQWLALLIVTCLVSILLLRSQSAASYPSYMLLLLTLSTFTHWRDVLQVNLLRWIIALLLWLSASTFWSEPFDLQEAISTWVRAALVFAFVVAVAECQLRGQMQNWMGLTMSLVGSIAVVAAIVNFWLTDPDDGRLNGLGQLDTHVIAALVYGVVLIFVIHFSTTWQGWLKIVAAIVIIATASAIYFSDSRNAWVSVSLAVGSYYVAAKSEDWRQYLLTLATAALLMAVLFFLFVLSSDTTREILLPRGASFRPEIWISTLERFNSTSSILLGHGILSSDDVYIGGFTFRHPHNMYLAVATQGGLIALFGFFVIVFLAFKELFRNFSSPDTRLALSILVLGLSAYLLDGHELVDKVGDTWLLFWLPIGLALGLALRSGSPQIEVEPN